jgi:hypothetical protein
LTSAKLDPLPYLQQASFSNNKIKTTEGIAHPKLETLNLNGKKSFSLSPSFSFVSNDHFVEFFLFLENNLSEIKGFDSDKLPNLQTLELRKNHLKSTRGITLPSLKSLFIAANEIVRLDDIAELKSLAVLHLRENPLENLDGFSEKLANLQYINLRSTQINDYAEIRKLKVLPKLRALALADTMVAENGDYRLEVLISIPGLERLDKDQYIDEEREEAKEIMEQRKQKEEEEAASKLENNEANGNQKASADEDFIKPDNED